MTGVQTCALPISNGTDGAAGTQGTQGTQGTNGTDGAQGVDGTDGTDGAQGAAGTNGTDGAAGPQGFQGAQHFTEEETKLGYLHNMQLRVPIDDTHTLEYQVNFIPSRTITSKPDHEDVPFEFCELKTPEGLCNLNVVTAQDALVWESQGALADRSREHLGVSDRGIVMLRKLLKEQIEIVRDGGDPIGIIRDPEKNKIIDLDTFHEAYGLYASGSRASEAAAGS